MKNENKNNAILYDVNGNVKMRIFSARANICINYKQQKNKNKKEEKK